MSPHPSDELSLIITTLETAIADALAIDDDHAELAKLVRQSKDRYWRAP